MVAPRDLGEAAAARLRAPVSDTEVCYVEGPERYTPQEVADAFSRALGRSVMVEVAPRDRWEAIYKGSGFSDAAARSYTNMTAVSLDGDFGKPTKHERGHVTLQDFIAAAVAGPAGSSNVV